MDSVTRPERGEMSEGEVNSTVGLGRGWFFKDEFQTPKVGGLRSPRFCSTRSQIPPCDLQSPQTASNVELSTLISELASQIGQSIAAQLQGDKRESESVSPGISKSEQRPTELNLSGVKLVMQSDVKEPPVFRGDNSDKCSVREWVEMVEIYFAKRNIPTHQKSQEILARLMGKAKDVVKVTLRHSPSLDQTPELIFDLLKQHFGELTYSSMPMADFYNTKPLQYEGVMEYWIRLNNAIDIADECLQRQGRSVEDPGREVSMMFIKYCPDPILYNRLSFKAAEEWTTAEVQERIDSFQRELRAHTRAGPHASQRHTISHTQSAMSYERETSQPVLAGPASQHSSASGFTSMAPTAATFSAAPVSPLTPHLSPTAAPFVPASAAVLTPEISQPPVFPHTAPVLNSQPTQSTPSLPTTQPDLEPVHGHSVLTPTPAIDVNSMHALIQLLDRMMARQNVQTANPAPTPSQQFAPGPFHRRNCQVCGDANHSTLMHCRRENLCLSCFSPGHWKRDCSRRGQRQVSQAAANQNLPSGN